MDYGIMGNVTFWQNFQGEFMWNRQPTSLSSHNPNDNTYSFVSNMNFDMYQFDVLYQFLSPGRKLRPFVVGGLGFFPYGVQPINGQSVLNFSNRFAYYRNHLPLRKIIFHATSSCCGVSSALLDGLNFTFHVRFLHTASFKDSSKSQYCAALCSGSV